MNDLQNFLQWNKHYFNIHSYWYTYICFISSMSCHLSTFWDYELWWTDQHNKCCNFNNQWRQVKDFKYNFISILFWVWFVFVSSALCPPAYITPTGELWVLICFVAFHRFPRIRKRRKHRSQFQSDPVSGPGVRWCVSSQTATKLPGLDRQYHR